MSLSQEYLENAALRLREAYGHAPIPSLRETLTARDVDQAYAIQGINTRYWTAQGRRVVGRKVGLTARAVQQQLGVDQPDFGVLFADMQVGDGEYLPASALLQGKVEAEVALVLASDLSTPDATSLDVLRATAFVLPALEIVDSRIADWKITYADTVADNASSAHFVLGREPRSIAGLDLRTCGMVLEVNGQLASLGAGAACLGHPLEAAAWLARALVQRGDSLRAGDVVLTGALGPMVSLSAGDHVRACIGGIGTVSFTLAKAPR